MLLYWGPKEMTEVSTSRILSDTFKTARHTHGLVPLLGDKLYFIDQFWNGEITAEEFEEEITEEDM